MGRGSNEDTSLGPALTFSLHLPRPDRAGSRLLTVVPMFPPFPIAHIPRCWDCPLPTFSCIGLHEERYSAGSLSLDSPIHSESQLHIPNLLGFPTIDTHSLFFLGVLCTLIPYPQQACLIYQPYHLIAPVLLKTHDSSSQGLNVLIPVLDRIRYVQSLKEIVINVPEQSAVTLGEGCRVTWVL